MQFGQIKASAAPIFFKMGQTFFLKHFQRFSSFSSWQNPSDKLVIVQKIDSRA